MSEQVGGIYYEVDLDTKQMLRSEREAAKSLRRVGDEAERMQERVSKVAAAVSAALGAIAIEGLVSKIIAAQRQFDVMFASLKTMTGGTNQAGEAFERLQKFAAKTPYSLEQAVQGFVKLKALGLDPGERAMTSYGNTAAAMGKNLSQMIEAVADASTGEFERLKEFGIKAKQEGDKVSLTFQGVTTTIKNSASEITEYLVKIGEVRFGGAMSERMKTLDGDISNLKDSLDGLYLSISQSGFGDAVAAGVRKASEAIAEATVSIKQGELTEYFKGLVPYIQAAELAVVTLAGAMAGRLLAAFVATAAQAYASAAAMGAATVAVRGFAAIVGALGGPIGIAVTGLALLALNWDKVAGSARDAAGMSEDAARRIAAALKKSPERATQDLRAQLVAIKTEMADIDKELGRTAFPKASSSDLADLRQRRATLESMARQTQAAMDGVGGGRPRPEEAPATRPAGSTPAAGAKGGKFDSATYLAGLEAATLEGAQRIDAIEQDALRKNDERLKAKDISAAEHARAVTLITLNASQDRAEIARREADEAIARQIDYGAAEEALAKERADARRRWEAEGSQYRAAVTQAVNPVEALRHEYEAKLALVTEYELLMAAQGIQATEQGAIARNQIETQYQLQRTALAEQSFRSQSEANAFLIDSLNALSTSAASSITGLITGTMTATDVMRNLAGVVLNEAVSALVQIGLQQIKNALLGNTIAAADKARAAANGAVYTASVSAQVAGMSAMAAQNAFAATAAIPIVGPALAPAAAALAGAGAAAIGAPAIATAPLAGARRYGGPTSANSLYQVNETGAPEMFTGSNGSQYMLPNKAGSVTPADQVGAGGVTVLVQVSNNHPTAAVTARTDDSGRIVQIAVNEVASQLANNTGPVWQSLRAGSNVQSRL